MPRTCSVKNCNADVKHKFKFPQANTDKERFLKWLAASGNSSLLSFSIKQLRTKGICEIHFESKYMLAKKLTTTAVPTLHLPDQIEVSSYKIVENNNIEYEPPKKRTKDNTTGFRHESDQQNILQCETESLDYTVFNADTENSPVKEILSTIYVNEKQGWTENNAQAAKATLVEENINSIYLQGVPEKIIVKKTQSIASTVRTNERKTVGKMCTFCKAFVKAGMRTHLVKLHQALEENPSEDTKDFIKNQLQALTTAIYKRMT